MDLLDIVHLCSISLALLLAVARMNTMHVSTTPVFEIFAWWLVGLGLGGDLCYQLYWYFRGVDYYIAGEHVVMSIGVAALVIVETQPEWRPLLADRRKRPTGKLPPDCDRRCQTYLDLRREK